MSVKAPPSEKTRRNWRKYLRAFGSAHRKASAKLETSQPLLQHLEELRQRTFKAFFALIVTTVLSFAFAEQRSYDINCQFISGSGNV